MTRRARRSAFTTVLLVLLPVLACARGPSYPWLDAYDENNALANRIAPPAGYVRRPFPRNSFGWWLRRLPLKPGRPPVCLFDGRKKGNQSAHFAVLDMDAGSKNLQQCADAVIRLRAEYLFSVGRGDAVSFNFTSGDPAAFRQWKAGYRPIVDGNCVSWRKSAAPDGSYASFRRYLTAVFMYAGSYSLSRELTPVGMAEMTVGDVFIQGGFPGHAVIVADMAVRPDSGRKVFLLCQSYMPAQDVHVLKNPTDPALRPWYALDVDDELVTPEWTFQKSDLKRFRPAE